MLTGLISHLPAGLRALRVVHFHELIAVLKDALDHSFASAARVFTSAKSLCISDKAVLLTFLVRSAAAAPGPWFDPWWPPRRPRPAASVRQRPCVDAGLHYHVV